MVLAGLQFSPFCGFGQVLNLIPGTGFPLHGLFLAMFLPGCFDVEVPEVFHEGQDEQQEGQGHQPLGHGAGHVEGPAPVAWLPQ